MKTSPYNRLSFHLVAGMVIVVVVERAYALIWDSARSAYSAEVDTKLIIDRVQGDLIRNGTAANSVSRIGEFLNEKKPLPPLLKDYEPPVIDAWGEPLHVASREFEFNKKLVNFGIYSFGPDGKSESEGCDPDDISAWADCDNEYWRAVHRQTKTRIWAWRLGISLAVGFGTFIASFISRVIFSGRD